MSTAQAKAIGSYYTPTSVAQTLVRWAVRRRSDRLLDPSCGDGQFLYLHPNSIGVEQDPQAAILASHRAPGCIVHVEDFFSYANSTKERFDCAAGNPPFIRYQKFAGETRARAKPLSPTWRRLFCAFLVVGALRCCGVKPPQARRTYRFCRAGGDWTRSLCRSPPAIPDARFWDRPTHSYP